MDTKETRHNFFTRLAHMGLALATITQLVTSLIFVAPSPGKSGNIWYEIHEYGGLTAFGFVLLFWLALTARRLGTAPGLLFPWFSGPSLRAVWSDTKAHLAAVTRFRLPPFEEHGALASAVHGLGLLLVTAMVATGTIYYFINTGNSDAGGLVGVLMFVHKTLANVVWAYLIGHAGLAVIHHFTDNLRLTEMWSLKP
ncbi:hypothetical protein B6V73_20020 [Thioclava sp. JM3]|uniref:cytochrome b/b6 domain-containing protein n=1 Tax=Thioclava sp. JM3 TaxID=1973004 RepID=UPI000B53ED16|nr:cytochrome b/b6 domain-containing protein [Thioclava sp. JM3]OWY08872.1 hypothetical protein B6V73_20020 [Thioclava sp. JM3]